MKPGQIIQTPNMRLFVILLLDNAGDIKIGWITDRYRTTWIDPEYVDNGSLDAVLTKLRIQ